MLLNHMGGSPIENIIHIIFLLCSIKYTSEILEFMWWPSPRVCLIPGLRTMTLTTQLNKNVFFCFVKTSPSRWFFCCCYANGLSHNICLVWKISSDDRIKFAISNLNWKKKRRNHPTISCIFKNNWLSSPSVVAMLIHTWALVDFNKSD